MSDERYIKLLTEINKYGLDKGCAVEVMAVHNATGQTVKQLCGMHEKEVLQQLIEGYLFQKEQRSKLEAENAALRERLSKAVELPYQRKRLLWGDKDKETLLCPDCLTDLMGGIGDETFVVQCPNCGCFVDCMVEPIPFTEAAEARLKELQGGKQ